MEQPKNWAEWLQLLLSAAPAAGPFLERRYSSILPFLNPTIADDMFLVTTVMALIAGVGAFRTCGHSGWRWRGFIAGMAIATVALLFLVALALGLILTSVPGLAVFVAYSGYLVLFLGISVATGSILAPS